MDEQHGCCPQAQRLLEQTRIDGDMRWCMAIQHPSGHVNTTPVAFCPFCGDQIGPRAAQGDVCGRSYGGWTPPLEASTCQRAYGHPGHCAPMGVMPGVAAETYAEQARRLDLEDQQKGLEG